MPSVIPLCPFPNALWFGVLLSADDVIVDCAEHYVKQSYRNRFDIAAHQGKLSLSFPVVKQSGVKVPVNQVRLDNEMHWKTICWRSIYSAYNSSPFFEYYRMELKDIFEKEDEFLINLNKKSLTWSAKNLGLDNSISFSEEYVEKEKGIEDYRPVFKGKYRPEITFPRYIQVFEERAGFIPNLSVLDILFNLGPESLSYLRSLSIKT